MILMWESEKCLPGAVEYTKFIVSIIWFRQPWISSHSFSMWNYSNKKYFICFLLKMLRIYIYCSFFRILKTFHVTNIKRKWKSRRPLNLSLANVNIEYFPWMSWDLKRISHKFESTSLHDLFCTFLLLLFGSIFRCLLRLCTKVNRFQENDCRKSPLGYLSNQRATKEEN